MFMYICPSMHLSGVFSLKCMDRFSSNLCSDVPWGLDAHKTDFGSMRKYGNLYRCFLSNFAIFLSYGTDAFKIWYSEQVHTRSLMPAQTDFGSAIFITYFYHTAQMIPCHDFFPKCTVDNCNRWECGVYKTDFGSGPNCWRFGTANRQNGRLVQCRMDFGTEHKYCNYVAKHFPC